MKNRIEKLQSFMGIHVSNSLMNFLKDDGFFTAPASTKYHGNYEGGLFDHSIAVAEALVLLTQRNNLEWKLKRSPYVVGMFHDLCKIDAYVRNADGSGWEHNKDLILQGHGEKSIIILQRFINLTDEEILCIRWHMGAFDEKENWNLFGKSVEKYPNVLWTHHADMIAARILGV